ncbi:hypothetical protein AURDEDRAFT_159588 [Auricularia subglabra TFB-10046 SS5]|nr:hypothetical protein AURDEDRAFT_159588 [Auricularia subglabra TFB-10046 SS5]
MDPQVPASPSGASTPLPVRSLSVPSALHALHSDELSNFLKHPKKIRDPSLGYGRFALATIGDFIRFLFSTWTRAIWDACFSPTVLLDRIAIVGFATLASFIMYGALLWCLFYNLPFVNRIFEFLSRRFLGGVSIANSVLPELFDLLSEEELKYAFESLSQPAVGSHETDTRREFDLDIAKLLLQCSAIMYERTSAPLLDALRMNTRRERWNYHDSDDTGFTASPDEDLGFSVPGAQLADQIGQGAARKMNTILHHHREEISIADFAAKYGLVYTTISEMNSQSSAGCGLFYHPDKTFIILAYKGTSPEEYSEWVTDLLYAPKHAGGWIHGFDKCHGGFFSKVFPARLDRGSRMPYTTIQLAISLVAKQLLCGKPSDTKINVWTTGHSLGCSLASLVYARQINEPTDFPPSVVIRDAYLFASPVLCDVTSVNAFDNRMRHHSRPRTMWRICNGKDLIATGLPHMGDYPEWGISAYNAFSFAHLGAELDLRPDVCLVRGTHVTPGSNVRIVTKYQRKASFGADNERRRVIAREALKDAQNIPLAGRLLAHAPVSYWIALTDIRAPSLCEWAS